VEKGFNSDIIYRGLSIHVQSEDWGAENPFIVTRVYQEGAVIKSVKTPYAELVSSLGFGHVGFRRRPDPQAIRLALREQHDKILDLLVSGQLF
jgi:hypothetical protein